MHKGGTEQNKQAERAIHVMSVIVTPILALYAVMATFDVFPNTTYSDTPITVLISALWIAASIYYYFRPATSRLDHALSLITIHFFALLMFTFVIGFMQPFAPFYVLLLLASHFYFGRPGLVLSIGAFLAAAFINTLVYASSAPDNLILTSITVFSVIFLGTAVIGVISAQETRRRALMHSQRQERLQYDRILTIINNLTDAAFSTDDKGNILLYNAACLDLLDTNDSLRGRNIGEVFKLKTTDEEPVNLADLLKESTRTTRRDDLDHFYADGESIRLEITFAPIRSSFNMNKKKDEHNGYILIMRDVTKQKSLEEERDEFIGVVSHELRTPITIVEGTLSNLEVMMRQATPTDPKLLADTVTTAHDQVMYLAKMVNDLSTLSRAERGVSDETEVIDVAELLHTLHQRYEKEADAKKLHLNLDLGPKLGKVNVSRLYLEELLQNFITNAIKYTKEGSVTIIGKRNNNKIEFIVKDTGTGISRTDQNKIFRKFYRSEDYRVRETSGTGLGLYVSGKLARKLGTQIELSSRLNHGSEFSFELPVE